jgi:hypothetical protein
MRHATSTWTAGFFLAVGILLPGSIAAAPTTLPIDQVGDVGRENAISIGGNGFPIVSYLAYDSGSGLHSLKTTTCGSSDCSTGNVTATVVAAPVQRNGGIAVPEDGRPVLVYNTSDATKFVRCGNASCTTGNTTVSLPGTEDSAVLIGQDGLPLVVSINTNSVIVTKCNDASCASSTETTTPVTNTGLVAVAVSPDGFPTIAMAVNNVGLRIARCASQAH